MAEYSLLGFAQYLEKIPHVVKLEEHRGLEEAAVLIENEAKRSIGEYQDAAGPFAAWQPLAESTLEQKARAGYAPPDNPLLRTGDLRDSIEHQVHEEEACVGSNSDIAMWQELGTNRIPPRSFLGAAAVRKEAEAVKILHKRLVDAMTGRLAGLF